MRDETVQIPSGPYRISTRIVGEGPLVILMHGWPELGLSWRYQIQPLAERGFTVAAPDMRGYGGSSKPEDAGAYGIDAMADDMAAIADARDHRRWVSIGHDWGSPVAWRTALRYPDRVAAAFSLSGPYLPPPSEPITGLFDQLYPDSFYYIRYFQQVGPPEAELERDVRAALKRIYFSLCGDAPPLGWLAKRPIGDPLLPGLPPPPPGPLSFMPDEVLDLYAAAFAEGGFFGPLSWYRNFESDCDAQRAYGDGIVRQPSGFLAGAMDVTLAMFEGALELQRAHLADMRVETILPGAGHWVQQERPAEVTAALAAFLDDVRGLIA